MNSSLENAYEMKALLEKQIEKLEGQRREAEFDRSAQYLDRDEVRWAYRDNAWRWQNFHGEWIDDGFPHPQFGPHTRIEAEGEHVHWAHDEEPSLEGFIGIWRRVISARDEDSPLATSILDNLEKLTPEDKPKETVGTAYVNIEPRFSEDMKALARMINQ